MRPLEALLLAALLSGLLALFVPWPAAGFRLWHLAALPALVATGQALAEGYRWQLLPAYVLSGMLFLVWSLRFLSGGGAAPMGLPDPGLAALALVAFALAAALPALLPVFRLPPPGGPYAVGTVTYHWVDEDRPEVFTADERDRREVMVQIWYPAVDSPALPRAPYVQGDILGPVLRLLRMPPFLFAHLKYVSTNARVSAPVMDGGAPYPVLLFSHGRGGFRGHSTRLVEELASHGYVVAAIDHPHAATGVLFPDGRLVPMHPRMADSAFIEAAVPYLAQDARFVVRKLEALNRADPLLAGRLDLTRLGILGVSLGGMVSAEACRVEPRLKACLAVDVEMPVEVLRDGLPQPALFLTRDAETMRREGWPEDVIDRTLGTMWSAFERLPGDGYFVQVRGPFHNDFSDAPLFTPLLRWLGAAGSLPAARIHAITNGYALAFFDRHLKGDPAPLLDGPASAYPEVRIATRRENAP